MRRDDEKEPVDPPTGSFPVEIPEPARFLPHFHEPLRRGVLLRVALHHAGNVWGRFYGVNTDQVSLDDAEKLGKVLSLISLDFTVVSGHNAAV
jgi:hypothetical protein